MDITWKSAGLQFVFAVVTGGVAGLMAGWILLRWQLRFALAMDETPKIINMIQSLETARRDLLLAYWRTPPPTGNSEVQRTQTQRKVIDEKIQVAENAISRLATQAEHLMSKRYKFLRAYLVLRGKSSRRAPSDGPDESEENAMLSLLSEFIEDIHEYIGHPRSLHEMFSHFSQQVKNAYNYFFNRLNRCQQELLVQSALTLHGLPSWSDLRDDRRCASNKDSGFDWNDYSDALDALIARGLLWEDDSLRVWTTRAGWKKAVALMKGAYEPSHGIQIDLA